MELTTVCILEVLLPLVPYKTASLVCRDWYEVAQEVCLPAVNFCPESIHDALRAKTDARRWDCDIVKYPTESEELWELLPLNLLMRASKIRVSACFGWHARFVGFKLGSVSFHACKELVFDASFRWCKGFEWLLSSQFFPALKKISGAVSFCTFDSWVMDAKWIFEAIDFSDLTFVAQYPRKGGFIFSWERECNCRTNWIDFLPTDATIRCTSNDQWNHFWKHWKHDAKRARFFSKLEFVYDHDKSSLPGGDIVSAIRCMSLCITTDVSTIGLRPGRQKLFFNASKNLPLTVTLRSDKTLSKKAIATLRKTFSINSVPLVVE